MNILVTGSAGFLGNFVCNFFHEKGHKIIGIDNLSRKGSHLNAQKQKENFLFFFGDISNPSDLKFTEDLDIDWIIDCAAEPSVLAGTDGQSKGLIDNNLISTINLLEICAKKKCGFTLMSTSRVYSVKQLSSIEIIKTPTKFFSTVQVDEDFSTKPPVSLYGSTKLTSELLALEYSSLYQFPVFINRCGVIAGAGQFGKIDQGVFSYWIYSWIRKQPLKYFGFDGTGRQSRDVIHPKDICTVLEKQIQFGKIEEDPIYCLGGGHQNCMSLLELSQWCKENISSDYEPESVPIDRPFDIPVFVMDTKKAERRWKFKITVSIKEILKEIRDHAKNNPDFLDYLYS
jgi:CDP-paratose 2-epimerase